VLLSSSAPGDTKIDTPAIATSARFQASFHLLDQLLGLHFYRETSGATIGKLSLAALLILVGGIPTPLKHIKVS